jgi:hypothetical protein
MGFPGFAGASVERVDFPKLLSQLEGPAGSRNPACVLVRLQKDDAQLKLARWMRSLAYRADVAVVELSLPLTAADVLHRALALLPRNLPADKALAMVQELRRYLVCQAFIDSVAALPKNVSIVKQLSGYLPGTWFHVDGEHTERVSGLKEIPARLQAGPPAASQVVVLNRSDDPGVDQWFGRAAFLDRESAPPRDYWGARRWVEWAYLTQDPRVLFAQLEAARLPRCFNCERIRMNGVCMFCGAGQKEAV